MEGEVPGEDTLLQKLRDSRHRFQRHMQELLEKYNQPFEDAPLVQMSTLTYNTPQGLRVWGGRLIKKRNKGQAQGSPVKTVGRKEGHVQVTARGPELPAPCTQDLGADSESGVVDAALYQEDQVAGPLTPAVPWSPLKDELRRKYLTQVDILLQDKACLEYDDDGDRNDTHVTLVPSLASPPRPAHGYWDSVSEEGPGGPCKPAASSRPYSTDTIIMPRSNSVSRQETSSNSFSSNLSFEADDICSVTISDLYAGMLHSMSRLLTAKPSCIISTKTFIVQNWNSRRRHKCKSRMNRTYYRGGRHARRSPPKRSLPWSEPVKEVGVLRDCQNLQDASGHKAGLKSEKAFLDVNKPQIRKLAPSWTELKGTPQKLSPLTYVDSSAMHRLDQENRLMTLKWLISPVKIVSRPRILQGDGGNHRELENKFGKLHQEYCLSRGKQPGLTSLPSSPRVHEYKGGLAGMGGARALETHRPSRPFSKAKPKSLNETFENLGKRAVEAGRCLASHSLLSLSKTNPSPSPGLPELMPDLLQGSNLGISQKSVSLSKAVSVPGVQPLGGARDRYDDIKEKFDKLHQKYRQKSPQQTKVALYTGASPCKAIVELQNQKEDFLGKLNPHSGFQGPQKLSSSSQWSLKHSRGSTTVVRPYARFVVAAERGPQPLEKRRRLSDPQVCGRWADSQHPSCAVGRAIPRPGEAVGSSQPGLEEKRKDEHIFQERREKGFCVRKLEAKNL